MPATSAKKRGSDGRTCSFRNAVARSARSCARGDGAKSIAHTSSSAAARSASTGTYSPMVWKPSPTVAPAT